MTGERFWSKVDCGEAGDCWPWMRCRLPSGYGKFGINRQTYLAHRVAYELTYGPIPPGLLVCHHCDNPSCCNPAHLFVGTNTTNFADMMLKGRSNHGERNAMANQRYASGVSLRQLTSEFVIGYAQLWNIVRRKYWKGGAA